MLATKNYTYPQYGKKMKSTSGLTRHLNAYTSLPLHILPNRNSPMLAENDDASDYFMHQEEEEYPLGNKKQNVKKDYRDLVGESSDNKRVKKMLLGHTLQDRLLESELSSSLREMRFSEQEFPAYTPISDIKYNHLGS